MHTTENHDIDALDMLIRECGASLAIDPSDKPLPGEVEEHCQALGDPVCHHYPDESTCRVCGY